MIYYICNSRRKTKDVINGTNVRPQIPLSQITEKTSFVLESTNYKILESREN